MRGGSNREGEVLTSHVDKPARARSSRRQILFGRSDLFERLITLLREMYELESEAGTPLHGRAEYIALI